MSICNNLPSSSRRVMQHLLSMLFVLLVTGWLSLTQARFIRRLCKNEIDLMSDEGVRIEPLERSHVELLLADHRVGKSNAIKFDFCTTGDNGILFYGRRKQAQGEMLALRLVGGDLYYTIHCSTVSADVLIPRNKLNDGNWHNVVVRFRRGGKKTQIVVDGTKDSKTYEVSCGRMTSLVFGGVIHSDKEMVNKCMGEVGHYDGCIRRVNIPNALLAPPKYYAISICEQ